MELATPHPDIASEATRLLGEAHRQGLVVRLLGGLAVRLHLAGGPHPAFDRPFKDIDLVTPAGEGRRASAFIESMGYVPDVPFNTVNAGRRALFYDEQHERQLDLFIASFQMCHRIEFGERLALDPMTVPLAELLLTKLQIVELNEKDQHDILALVESHEIGESDDDMINAEHVAFLCAADWGLWRTCKLNLGRVEAAIDRYQLSADERGLIRSRLTSIESRIDKEPKTRRWKLRDRLGDRVRWYGEPDEVA